MKELKADYFFDLVNFKHRELFDGEMYVWEVLNQLEDYLRTLPLGEIQTEVPQGAFIIEASSIYVGEGTIIEPGAYIKGPCYIGKNCVVRHGAYIRGNVLAGDGCVIGHDTELKNTIMLDHAHAAHFAYAGDSILGNRVNLGAGTKCANLKLDNTKVNVHFEGRKIATHLRKLGAILGDNTQIGCNVVTNPGTLMGKEVCCYPCVNVGGFIPSHSLIKLQNQPIITKKIEKAVR